MCGKEDAVISSSEVYLDSWTCHHVAGLQQTAEHKASGYELYSLCNSPSLVYLLG